MSSFLSNERLNEKYIDLMETLSSIMLKQGEPFRSRAYQKAQEAIITYPSDIIDPNQLKGVFNIGPTILEKLIEYNETGTLKIIEREKSNPVNILADVYGIGPKKAAELVDNGIISIDDLRKNQDKLNDVQKVGLKYYEDILKRIPRSEIDQYANIFMNEFQKVTQKVTGCNFEIVGSYRRGAVNSGDIDVIITSENPQVFVQFISELINKKIIIEVLSRGLSKCLVIAKIPSSNTFRRVDFLYAKPDEYPFSILYFTGSKIFNTVMRGHALSMNLSMNEHGLYKMEEKKKGEKVSHIFKDEKDIFDFLNMEYKLPNERIDGRAVVIKQGGQICKDTICINNKTKTMKNRAKKVITGKKKEQSDISIDINNFNNNFNNIFKQNGITVLETMSEKQLSTLLGEANKAYYNNNNTFLTDNEYDIIKEYTEKKYPGNHSIMQVGAPVERNKVTLPYQMWSMDKIKPDTDVLGNWVKKYSGPYIISSKLDGVSGLYTTEGKEPKLYTRGNGTVGQDISHLIPYLRLPKTKGIVIRGEIIIPRSVFHSKYKNMFANPRNMVSGVVNHKTISDTILDIVSDLHFVAYELIKPILKPSEQLQFIKTLDLVPVMYKVVDHLSNELLSQMLIEGRENCIYEIDGIIVTDDKIYERKTGNPEHAFAFKMVLSDQIAEAKVVDVLWTPSKDGYLKPRVRIEPIQLGGVCIEYATGFNGAFINDNKIGVGAIIELIRSGDVIPYIRKVIVPATCVQMPSVPYKWNNTHVDIMLENIGSDETVKEKNITGFFRGIGVEGLSSGNILRIIKTGFDTVPKILKMTTDDLLKVEGFKMKMASKIHDGIIEQIVAASLVTLMSGSNIFGRGFSEKKLELIIEAYPDVLLSQESVSNKVKKISQIKGMADKTAEAFVEKIHDFVIFMKESGLEYKLHIANASTSNNTCDVNNPLYGKTIVITGFRDMKLQDTLKNLGAKIGTSVSKNTFVVLVKDINSELDTGKALDAKKLAIPIMTYDDFNNKYL